MEATYSQQLSTFVISLITGAFLGAVYDAIRILRCIFGVRYYNKNKPFWSDKVKSRKARGLTRLKESILIFITDILFFVFSGVTIAIIVYYVNSGIVRWYILMLCLFGFLAYYFTVGRLVIRIADRVATVIRLFASSIVYLLVYPLKPIVPLTKRIFLLLKSKPKSAVNKSEDKKREVLLSYGK